MKIMGYIFSGLLLLFLMPFHLGMAAYACSKQHQTLPIADGLVSPGVVLEKGWLSETVQAFLDVQNDFVDFRNTGFSKTDYLDIIEGQVRMFMTHQDAEGRIIDPVKLEEKHYVTSLYAHSVAVLAASGHVADPDVIESGMLAMDVVTKDMSENRSAWALEEQSIGTGDFYTWPTMFAFDLFEGIASPERHALWGANIARMQPSEFYHAYHAYATNWNVVNLAGEFYRYLRGFTTIDYVESCLQGQLYHFTEFGMYDENGNPLAYDIFSRHYIAGMLAMGYDGAHRKTYARLLEKGAWMSLFMQSPFGELPTGFRSSHHIWNEALQCMIFEIYATAYAQAGYHHKAGAFKRGAYLSLSSLKEWIRQDGSGYVVKNKYPIEAEHGYEGYSNHSDYNLLATSILAQAWQFANDAIKEMAAPADIGGYVINIHDPFHKVIAAADRSYVQYDTRGDQLYNPTGILRVHVYGSHPQLGPSDGVARRFGGEGVSIATGPLWKTGNGNWRSLAAHRGDDPDIEILTETPALTSFIITHRIADGQDYLIVSETITVTHGKVMVDTKVEGNIDGLRITWPMLVFNGSEHTMVDISDDSVTLELEGRQIRFEVVDSDGHTLTRSNEQYAHRNGMVEPLVVETIGNRVVYMIGLP